LLFRYLFQFGGHNTIFEIVRVDPEFAFPFQINTDILLLNKKFGEEATQYPYCLPALFQHVDTVSVGDTSQVGKPVIDFFDKDCISFVVDIHAFF
jgi:hypothetical protein